MVIFLGNSLKQENKIYLIQIEFKSISKILVFILEEIRKSR